MATRKKQKNPVLTKVPKKGQMQKAIQAHMKRLSRTQARKK